MKPYNYYDAVMTAPPMVVLSQVVVSDTVASDPDFGKPGYRKEFYSGSTTGETATEIVIAGNVCRSWRTRDTSTGETWSESTHETIMDAMLAYAEHGQQCYVVDSNMERDLAATSTKGVPRRHLRLPFPGFYVALPDTLGISTAHIWAQTEENPTDPGAPAGVWATLAGVFVTQRTPSLISMTMFGRPLTELGWSDWDVPTAHLTIDLSAVDWTNPDGLMTYLEELLSDSTNVESDRVTWSMEDPRYAHQIQKIRECMRHVMTLTVNLCLYVNSKGADLVTQAPSTNNAKRLAKATKKAKRARSLVRLKKRLARSPQPAYTFVGRGYESAETRQHFRKAHWHKYYVGPRKYANGEKIPLVNQATEIKWVAMTEVNRSSSYRTESRTYVVEGA